jgi:hypothetical protein
MRGSKTEAKFHPLSSSPRPAKERKKRAYEIIVLN